MLRSLVTTCLISACFPVGGRAQDTNQSGFRPTVTLQSTITVVPIAFTTPTDEYLPAPPSPTCDVGKVDCSACDGEHVDVDGGYTYRIHCDAALSSNTSILQPAYITPNQCLVVCDNASDCVGTTLAANGSCVLSIGRPDYRVSSSTGSIAFEQIRYFPVNIHSKLKRLGPIGFQVLFECDHSTGVSHFVLERLKHANTESAKAVLHQLHPAECNIPCELVCSNQQHMLQSQSNMSSLR